MSSPAGMGRLPLATQAPKRFYAARMGSTFYAREQSPNTLIITLGDGVAIRWKPKGLSGTP